jgi:putative peptide zinc metalloprotease protein
MEIVNIKGEKYNYLLKTRVSRFYISDLVCEIIRLLQTDKSDQEIAQILYTEKKLEVELQASDIADIKEKHIKPLGILTKEGKIIEEELHDEVESASANNSIMLKKTILGPKQIASITPYLQWLFDPRYFNWLLGITFLVNLILGVSFYQGMGEYINFKDLAAGETSGLWYLLLYYPTAIIVLLFHELGHATPAYQFGTPPKSIGFGMYLIFPVFYADVTATWALDKKQRMIVNIGGIYVQLLINSLLLILLPYLPQAGLVTAIFLALINLNFLTLFININPFFKFDGYWLYSDYFGLPNLHRKAASYLRSKVFRNDTVAAKELNNYNTFWLKLYSCLYLAFLFFIMYLLIQGLVFSFSTFGSAIGKIGAGDTGFATIFRLVTVCITCTVITVIVYRRIRTFYLSLLVKNSSHV